MKKGVIIVGSGRGSAFAERIIRDGARRVVALVDNNTGIHGALKKRFAEEYGSPDTAIVGSLQEALARFPKSEADTVLIVTPNHTHAEMLRLALEAGRHALLEKPVAADYDDLLRIARMTADTEQVVQLGFVLRYSPFFRAIKETIDSGRIGRVALIQLNEWLDFAHSANAYRRGWRRSHALTGGFLNEKCSHDLDLLCYFKENQAEATRIYSVAGTQMFPPKVTPASCLDCDDRQCPFRYRKSPYVAYQLADTEAKNNKCVYHSDADIYNIQSVTLTFADGTQGILTLVPYSGEPARTLTIHGTEGYITGHMEQGELKIAVYRESGMELKTIPLSLADDGHGGGDSFILQELFDCIENGTAPAASVYDGLRASAIAFAADASAGSGQAVELSDWLEPLKTQNKVVSICS